MIEQFDETILKAYFDDHMTNALEMNVEEDNYNDLDKFRNSLH